ncbi:hypothetical protein [Zunongwangia sp. HRR-M8]|uniref:hypothetical protein n=1 Tax=Zunongwangia sp. HRR-M8 TaxID=3015170 RepID=UPI0022DE482C|nr:hypothetical protein [Zunongwangia sp. HRR-M8]WBL21292.1 hypothetical protein PBT89_11155 [Zunongwangia sp. HRR-M8]
MKIKHFCIIIYFAFVGVHSQVSRKDWNEGNLTWNDFQEREIAFEHSISELKYTIGYTTEKQKRKDTVILRLQSFCYIDPQISWVHPDFKTEENLEYNQIIFDIAELYRRKLQYELDRLGSYYSAETVFQNIYQNLNDEVAMFQKQSDYGRNYAVILQWKPNIEDRLDIYNNNKLPEYEKAKFGLGFNVGALYSFRNGEVKEHFGNSISFLFGFDLAFKNSILNINGALSGGRVKDDYLGNIYWEQRERFSVALIDISYGYAIIDNSKLKLAPFAGLAITEFSEVNYDGEEHDLIMTDFNFLLGLSADFKLRTHINTIPNLFLGRKDISFSAIRAKLFVSKNDFYEDLNGYSVNLSIGYSWFGNMLKPD